MTHNITRPSRHAPCALLLIVALALVTVSVVLGGCGGTTASIAATSTTVSRPSSTGATSTTIAPQSALTPEQKAYTDELKVTAAAALELSKKLEAEGIKESDPRAALFLGLRARTQAVSARKFINDKDLGNADLAYREARTFLARASVYATDAAAAAVKSAQTRLDALTAPPAQDATAAAAALDAAIKDLAPLVEIANKETGATTTTGFTPTT